MELSKRQEVLEEVLEHIGKEDWDKATEILGVWLQRNPQDGEARYLLGTDYAQQENFERALQELEKAVKQPFCPGESGRVVSLFCPSAAPMLTAADAR